MYLRALAIWLVVTVVAVLNGTVRTFWITPRAGAQIGHVISTVTLSCAIFVVAWLAIRRIGPTTTGEAVRIGVLWLALTLAFEFGVGHFVFRNSWEKLFADYNILRGRVWVVILIVVAVAPLIVARARGLLASGGD